MKCYYLTFDLFWIELISNILYFFLTSDEQPTDEAQAPAPDTPAKSPAEMPAKTPKSPTKTEPPPTPSKKVKEIPPIPTFELNMVLASGNCVVTLESRPPNNIIVYLYISGLVDCVMFWFENSNLPIVLC